MSLILDDITYKKKNKDRNSKSLGYKIIENKKRLQKFHEKNNKTFNDAIIQLNKTLKKSESLLHINHYPEKNDITLILPNNELNYLKKVEYYKKWHFNNILPKIDDKKKEDDNKKEYKNNYKSFGSIFRPNKNYIIRNNRNYDSDNEKDKIPFYLKPLVPKRRNIKANEIVKISIKELNKKNKFKKYCYKLEEKVGNYVESNDKFSNYYDFDNQLKRNIKEEMTGISIPGNVLNLSSIGFIKTIQPKNIRIRIKKNVPVPERTLLPVPNGLAGKGVNYTHITLKNLYSEKNKMI